MRKVYPSRSFLSLAVPGLLAVFPLDVFFGMNRDVLSPLLCAAALLLMANALTTKTTQYQPLLLASFLVGLSFLVEISNFVLYGALEMCIRDRLKRWLLRPNFEAQSPPLYYVAAAAWYNLGAALGMRDWGLDYWPRFLNPIAYALLV